MRRLVAWAATTAAFLGPQVAGADARPAITTLHWTQTGTTPGAGYEVIESATMRVCARRGRLVLRVREQETGYDGTVSAQHFRKSFRRQTARCQTHTLRWTLGDAFFGVGVYRLRFTVTDSAGVTSRPVFRKSATGD